MEEEEGTYQAINEAAEGKSSFKMEDLKVGYRMEAKDFDGKWYPVKVAEIDWDELEVLVHFENWNAKFDEWLPFNSDRLRPFPSPDDEDSGSDTKFKKGESVMAYWSPYQRFPGTIQAVLSNDRYEVLFYDGFIKRLKSSKVYKIKDTDKPLIPIKPVTDIGSKEERRERKRKINVAELFQINKKRVKKGLVSSGGKDLKTYPANKPTKKPQSEAVENQEPSSSPLVSPIISTATSQTSPPTTTKQKVVSPATLVVKYMDGRSEVWHKEFYRRSEGRSAGKRDIVITNSQGRKFRCRNEIMKYCEENQIIYSPEAFDFSVRGRPKNKSRLQTDMQSAVGAQLETAGLGPVAKKPRSKSMIETTTMPTTLAPVVLTPLVNAPVYTTPLVEEEEDKRIFIGDVEVIREDGQLKCPGEGCNKHFRKEKLLHMHMKHYHPEFSKFLDYTPSVTDLAYARTATSSLEPETQPSGPTPKKQEKDKPGSKADSEKSARKSLASLPISVDSAKEIKKNITKQVDTQAQDVKPATPGKTPKQTQSSHNLPAVDLLQQSPASSSVDLYQQQSPHTPNTLPYTAEISPSDTSDKWIKVQTPVDMEESQEHGSTSLLKKRKRYQESLLEHLKRRRVDLDGFTRKDKMKPRGARHGSLSSRRHPPFSPVSGDELSNSSSQPFSPVPHRLKSTSSTERLLLTADTSDGATEGTEDSKSPLPHGGLDKLEKLRRNEIINCSCGVSEEDGLMIQCDLCLCWQHGHCLNIYEATQVPEKYTCHTCKHPFRGRSSMKYYNDQAWIKDGVLPSLSYRAKKPELVQERSAMLKRSFDLSGSLSLLKKLLYSLNVKLNIAQKKDHPKLWLWAKKWMEKNSNRILDDSDRRDIKPDPFAEGTDANTSMKFAAAQQVPKAPEPEAPIDPVECRLNLLDHILHFESIVDARLSSIESQIAELESMEEDAVDNETSDKCPRTKATVQMLLRDLSKMRDVAVAMT